MASDPDRIPVQIDWRVDGFEAVFSSPPLATGAAMILWASLIGAPMGCSGLLCGLDSGVGLVLAGLALLLWVPALIFLLSGGSLWEHRVRTTLTLQPHRLRVSNELEVIDLPLIELRSIKLVRGHLELRTDDRVVRIRADGNKPGSIHTIRRALQRLVDQDLDAIDDRETKEHLDRLLQRSATPEG